MLAPRASNLFVLALAISVLAHAGILTLVGVTMHRAAQLRELARIEIVPKLAPVELSLGLEAPHPDATAWLGFEEEMPQIAEPAAIEQAAFDPMAGPNQPAPDLERQPATPQEQVSNEQATEPKRVPIKPHSFDDLLQKLIKNIQMAARETADTTEKPVPATQPVQLAQADRQEGRPAQDMTLARAAVPAEKESQPTSIIDVTPDQWQIGKPLAAQGLEIKTKRPVFTVLTMMTAAPGNPLCEIKFDREGVAKSAVIVRSSGDQRVDDAILASLYRWRAEGSNLKSLQEKDTIAVRIRMILSHYSRDDNDEADSTG